MAKNTRVTVEAEGGRTYSLSRNTVLAKIANQEMRWKVEGKTAEWTTSRRGCFDASGFFTNRCFWKKKSSFGFRVLQMSDLPRGARILRPAQEVA